MPNKLIVSKVSDKEKGQIDCGDYLVEFFKCENEDENTFINYTFKDNICVSPSTKFYVNWESEDLGGRFTIKHFGRFGCTMEFVHYDPVPIKELFEFIGKGYQVFDRRKEFLSNK